MKIKIAMFAAARQAAGADHVEIEVEAPATVGKLKTAFAEAYPEMQALLARSVFSVDLQYADDEKQLVETAEVALIPPVSGG